MILLRLIHAAQAGAFLMLTAFLAAMTFLALQVSTDYPAFQMQRESFLVEVHYQNIAMLRTQAQAQKTLAGIQGDIRGIRENSGLLVRNLDDKMHTANLILTRTAMSLDDYLLLANKSLYIAATSLDRTANATAQLENQASDIIGEMFDCEAVGAACLQRQIFNTTAALQRTAEAVEKAAPEIAASALSNSRNVETITANVGTLTGKLTEKRGFWGKIYDNLIRAAVIAARVF